MKKSVYVTINGQVINAKSAIEKVEDAIKKMGVDLGRIDDTQALFLAANVSGKTVPEFLGI